MRFAAGAWYGSDEACRLLTANGMASLEDALAAGELLDGASKGLGNRHTAREITQVRLNEGAATVRAYVKKQWCRERLIPRMAEFRDETVFLTQPAREWRHLGLLRSLGLDTAEPLGLFSNGWLGGQAAIVTRAVPPEQSLETLATSGKLVQIGTLARIGLAQALARVVDTLRGARLSWRSMKPKHFYPMQTAESGWRIWLIDCEGLRCNAGVDYFSRDFSKLMKELRRIDAPGDFVGALTHHLNLSSVPT